MEAIKTYVDNVFAAFPQSEEVKTLKREMLANMEEKYIALRQSGKSEHEAAYSVIADFGSMDEIVAELGSVKEGQTRRVELSKEGEAIGTSEKQESVEDKLGNIFLSWDEAHTYIEAIKRSGIIVGLGVWIILIGVASVVSFGSFGVFTLFVGIAIAVAMFTINSYKMEIYEKYESTPISLDAKTRAEIEAQNAHFTSRFGVKIAIGVAIILIAVGTFVTFNFFGVSSLLVAIGFSVFIFVSTSMTGEAFEVLLNIGDYEIKKGG